jgi:hypothetical protein
LQIVLGLTQLSHSVSQSRVFVCGSMVRFDHMFVFFALYERKKDKREKGSTALPKAKKRQLRKSYNKQIGLMQSTNCLPF